MSKFKQWMHKHQIKTTLMVVWMLALTTIITIKVFFDPVDIPTGTAAAFATLFALPGIAVGLYKWRQEREDKIL